MILQYKGYTGDVEIDEEAGVLHGRLLGMRGVVSYQAETGADLRKEFRISVDDYLAWCAELGREPEKPFSGKFVVRVAPELHRRAVYAARARGQSLNAFIEAAIAGAVGPEAQGGGRADPGKAAGAGRGRGRKAKA